MQFVSGLGRHATLVAFAVTFLFLAARPAGATHIDTEGPYPHDGPVLAQVSGDGETDAFTGPHHHGEGEWTGTDPDPHHAPHLRTARVPGAPSALVLGLGLTALLLGIRMARRRAA